MAAKARKQAEKRQSRPGPVATGSTARAERIRAALPQVQVNVVDATASLAAAHVDLTDARVNQLAQEGTLPRNPDGTYDIDAVRIAYIRHLRMQAGRRAKTAGKTVDLNDARHRMVELNIQKETAQLIPSEDVEATVSEVMNTLRTSFAGLAASVTRDLELRATIEGKINDAIDQCRRAFEEAEQALWTGGESDVEDEEAAS